MEAAKDVILYLMFLKICGFFVFIFCEFLFCLFVFERLVLFLSAACCCFLCVCVCVSILDWGGGGGCKYVCVGGGGGEISRGRTILPIMVMSVCCSELQNFTVDYH